MNDNHIENVSIARACEIWGIGRTKMFELIAAGDIHAIKLGRRTLVRVDSIRAFVERLPSARNGSAG